MLEIRQATKRFMMPEGRWLNAVDSVSMEISQNEFVTLLGPSGCGKTTLLRAISGFEDLDEGDILIRGESVAGVPAYRRPVNTVFQRYALFPHLSVHRNVAYSLEVAHVPKPEIESRVGKMLELVGLAGYGQRKIPQLSGGQQQRVALARALVARPQILLLDEPLSALDKNLRRHMQFELKALQNEVGIAFVFVTHDQEEALTMSDRIAVLKDGSVQQIGSPEALYQRPINAFVASFVGESNLLSGKVIDVTDRESRVVLEGGQQALIPEGGLAKGQVVQLLLRPEDILLGPVEDGRGLSFEGTVSRSVFTGNSYRLEVKPDGLPEVTAAIRVGRAAPPEPGSKVCLSAPHDSLHLVPVRTDAL